MFKVAWIREGKECVEECKGFGEARIRAKMLQEEGINNISIWRLEAIL